MSGNNISPRSVLHFGRDDVDSCLITVDNILDFASSDNVSDAIKNLYGYYGLLRGVKPVKCGLRASGFVRTVSTNSDDWGTCIKAIYEAVPGEILVIKCSDENLAVWGELASRAAMSQDLAGTVIIGSSRDTGEVAELEYPLFSSSTMSSAGKAYNRGIISCDLFVENFVIKTGDFAVCDDDGVVIIPKDCLDDVFSELNSIKNFEQDCISRMLDNGEHLDDILGI